MQLTAKRKIYNTKKRYNGDYNPRKPIPDVVIQLICYYGKTMVHLGLPYRNAAIHCIAQQFRIAPGTVQNIWRKNKV